MVSAVFKTQNEQRQASSGGATISIASAAQKSNGGSPAAAENASPIWLEQLNSILNRLADGEAADAKSATGAFANRYRAALGLPRGVPDAVVDAAGLVWQIASLLSDANRSRNGQQVLDLLETLQGRGLLNTAALSKIRATAQELKATAPQTGQADRGPYTVYTTGSAAGVGGGGVTSRQLRADGQWTTSDWLGHHSDRSNSWAANQIRNSANSNLQAYDFTFEQSNAQGQGIEGTALGLELILPGDSKVLDIHKSYAGSGGYGMFIHLEDVATGLRYAVNHLDAVSSFSKGQVVAGGTVFGRQGGSGKYRQSYATHVDIVGSSAAVEMFVRAQQTGQYSSQMQGN